MFEEILMNNIIKKIIRLPLVLPLCIPLILMGIINIDKLGFSCYNHKLIN